MRTASNPIWVLTGLVGKAALAGLVVAGSLLLAYFPWDQDAALSAAEIQKTREYYAQAYKAPPVDEPSTPDSERYVTIATAAAKKFKVEDKVRTFVEQFSLADKHVLDVGSGRGNLQDMVKDYTGLDISSAVGRFYHKPFVIGSATAMPFEDNSFDAVWTVWVLEHIPAPEQALREIRRVVKPGGHIFLMPAWGVTPYVANGYGVRAYSDLSVGGKLMKASIGPRTYSWALAQLLIRPVRNEMSKMSPGPTTFHYRRLQPNYETYWEADSDAVNSLDRFETALWFTSRGDSWLNQGEDELFEFKGPLILQVEKPDSSQASGKRPSEMAR